MTTHSRLQRYFLLRMTVCPDNNESVISQTTDCSCQNELSFLFHMIIAMPKFQNSASKDVGLGKMSTNFRKLIEYVNINLQYKQKKVEQYMEVHCKSSSAYFGLDKTCAEWPTQPKLDAFAQLFLELRRIPVVQNTTIEIDYVIITQRMKTKHYFMLLQWNPPWELVIIHNN